MRIIIQEFTEQIFFSPFVGVDIISPRQGVCPGLASSVWSDLTLPARQHGSDAAKCHFAVLAQRELLWGLIHGGRKQNGTKVTVKGQTTRLIKAAKPTALFFFFTFRKYSVFMLHIYFNFLYKCVQNSH